MRLVWCSRRDPHEIYFEESRTWLTSRTGATILLHKERGAHTKVRNTAIYIHVGRGDAMNSFEPDFTELRQTSGLEEYGRFEQHLTLLEDVTRVASYNAAIKLSPVGDVVVDVGAGTGVLALLALKKGFNHAFLIEPSKKMARYAQHLAELNSFGDRVTVLQTSLEHLDFRRLPSSIDLIVTETISSVFFGFGSWDRLGALIERTSPAGTVIPLSGTLYGFLVDRHFSTSKPEHSGLRVLEQAGLKIDLYELAFRSGGNIFDKNLVNFEVSSGSAAPFKIISFNTTPELRITDAGSTIHAEHSEVHTGIVVYWQLQLEKEVWLDSRDPRLTSWFPYYIPFRAPFRMSAGESANIRLTLRPLDAPYTYAIQVMNGNQALTNTLYW